MLSDGWLKYYPNLCTCIPPASTFKLSATGCYRHADASKPIPFDSLDRRIPTHPVPMLSDGWLKYYPNLCTCIPPASTFKLSATGCYRHVDASRPIPFDSPRQPDCNETLPDSGGHLLAVVSALFTLLTSIAMWTLRELYHSIPLAEWNPTHSVPTLSDRWFKGYPYFCTVVLRASTFKLLATKCYCFLD